MKPLKKHPLILCIIIMSLIYLIFHYHFIINITSSMPKGLYIDTKKTQIEPGDIIAICLPARWRVASLQRGYLRKGIYCQGLTPLIKQVVALPHDQVVVSPHFILVNGKHRYPIKLFVKDSRGETLTPFPPGKFNSPGYWVLGMHDQRSWDSRYIGFVDKKSVLCILKPIVTW